jgi:hypothetical protein
VRRARILLRSALLLAFALTLAQIGAMTHGYTHWQSGSGNPDRAALHSTLCGECASFGAVLLPGGSPGAAVTLPVMAQTGTFTDPSLGGAFIAPRHHFQSQGPPSLC